jgi:hypothetical protein
MLLCTTPSAHDSDRQSGFKSREALELKSPRVNMLGNPVEPDRQGYLFKKIPKKGKGWKCSWFVLERGILMYYKNIKVRPSASSVLNKLRFR